MMAIDSHRREVQINMLVGEVMCDYVNGIFTIGIGCSVENKLTSELYTTGGLNSQLKKKMVMYFCMLPFLIYYDLCFCRLYRNGALDRMVVYQNSL